MSDDEKEYSEEEEEEEEEEDEAHQKNEEKVTKKAATHEETIQKSETEILMEEKFKKKKDDEEESWKEYIETWRKQRTKEEDDLKKLKEKQLKRKSQREAEERKMTELKRQQEETHMKAMEEKRQREMEEKRRRLEEAEKRRQAMLQKVKQPEQVKPNFVIEKRSDGGPGVSMGGSAMDKMMNVAAARGDMGKTKEQLLEDKKIALSFRVKPLEIEGLDKEALKDKAKELWEAIIKLETDKYDLEERHKRQEYDLKELNERQRQINRNKALKKGFDPEQLSGRYPPKLQVASKYERRIDRRTYDDKKLLFDGGFESQVEQSLEKNWNDKMSSFEEKKGRCLKWLGEQTGKKKPEDKTQDSAKDVAEEEEEEEEEVEEEDEEDEDEEED